MSEKRKVPLGNLLFQVTTRTGAYKERDVPYIGLENIPSGGTKIGSCGRSEDSISSNTIFESGDILFGKLRPRLRKSVRAQFRGYCSTDILVLRVAENVHPGFAGYVAQSDTVFSAAIRTEEGTKMPRCSWGDIQSVEVFCPVSNKEQAKIASVLASLDLAIEKTEALIEKYQQIKAGLMHDLFTRGVLPDGKLRPTREQAPELYRETGIGWVPKEWGIAGLASKGRANNNWIRTGPFGSALKGEHWRKHGHPVITIGALGEGEFIKSELLFVSDHDASRLHDFQLRAGDVVFSRVADVGRSVVVKNDNEGWIMSSNLMRIAVDEQVARPDFLQMALSGDTRVKKQIRSRVNSGGRDVANSDILNQLKFIWPSIAEQDKFIAIATRINQRIIGEQKKSAKLQKKKTGLMHDLLTGKVAVKVNEAQEEHV